MSRRLAALTLDTLKDLPTPCRTCLAWELDPVTGQRAVDFGFPELEKEVWVSAVLLDWGSCGRIAYLDDTPVGYVMYAPAPFVPRSHAFPTSPVSPDAVLLMTGGILAEHRGGGLARMLIQSAAKDLTRRGVRAIEAFGREPTQPSSMEKLRERTGLGKRAGGAADVLPEPEPELGVTGGDRGRGCLVPAEFLRAVGFATVRPHSRVSRLRLELRTALSWREDVEAALEKILNTVRVPALSRVGE